MPRRRGGWRMRCGRFADLELLGKAEVVATEVAETVVEAAY